MLRLTPDQIAARERCAAATPGPWKYKDFRFIYYFKDGRYMETVADILPTPKLAANGAFIAAARTDLPAALDTIEEMEATVRRLRNERNDAISDMCGLCRSADKKAGIRPVCSAGCKWIALTGQKEEK
jgi:hypothetical protein